MTTTLRFVRRIVAVVGLLLVSPAALFMAALVVRSLQPVEHEPARTAHRIVLWYAGRPWTLWVLLMALPLAVLVTGSIALAWSWRDDAELRQSARQTLAAVRAYPVLLLLAAVTLAAAVILGIVAVHAIAD